MLKLKMGIRQLEDLGRFMIPKEIRDELQWKSKMSVAFFMDEQNGELFLRKNGCVFCNGANDIIHFKGRRICRDCLDKLNADAMTVFVE